jgi:hypothetical protein
MMLALLAALDRRAASAQPIDPWQSDAERAARDPAAAVDTAVAGRRVIARASNTVDTPAVPTRNGADAQRQRLLTFRPPRSQDPRSREPRCFLLIATAGGVPSMSVEIAQANAAERSVQIAAATVGRVQQHRFCIAANVGRVELSAMVPTRVPARWALAVLAAPAPEAIVEEVPTPGLAARERLTRALMQNSEPSNTDAGFAQSATNTTSMTGAVATRIGGREEDFVAAQLRAAYASVEDARALQEPLRASLHAAQQIETRVRLEQGRCYEAAAAGVPSITDVDVAWFDASGGQLAQDSGHRSSERVRLCPRISGSYRATARVFAGTGLVALQIIEVASP